MSSILSFKRLLKPQRKATFWTHLDSNEIIRPGLISDWDSVWFIPSNLRTKYFCLLPKPIIFPQAGSGKLDPVEPSQHRALGAKLAGNTFGEFVCFYLGRVCEVAIWIKKAIFRILCFPLLTKVLLPSQ